MASNPIPWTPEEDHALREYWETKLSCSQIAERIPGRSKGAIIGRVGRLKLQRRRAAPSKTVKLPRKKISKYSGSPIQIPIAATPTRLGAFDPLPGHIPLSLMELRPTSCRWTVLGGFCGAEVHKGSWCDTHRSIGIRKIEA